MCSTRIHVSRGNQQLEAPPPRVLGIMPLERRLSLNVSSDVCAAATRARSCSVKEKGVWAGNRQMECGAMLGMLLEGLFGEEGCLLQARVCVGANVRSLAWVRCLLLFVVQYARISSSAVGISDKCQWLSTFASAIAAVVFTFTLGTEIRH